jgi:ABC-type proline/glycine betaine transport system permease subunit
MAWLQRSILLSIVFGFFGGPLSFIAAEKLGALVVTDTYSMQTSLLVIGCVWGVALPLVVQIAARFSAALK